MSKLNFGLDPDDGQDAHGAAMKAHSRFPWITLIVLADIAALFAIARYLEVHQCIAALKLPFQIPWQIFR
jgi:hypothetical protein